MVVGERESTGEGQTLAAHRKPGNLPYSGSQAPARPPWARPTSPIAPVGMVVGIAPPPLNLLLDPSRAKRNPKH